MSDLQHDIVAWAEETFPNSTMNAVREHWREEVRELDDCLSVLIHHGTTEGVQLWDRKHKLDIDPETHDSLGGRPLQASIAEECADVMHLMFQIAERCGFDLLDEIQKKFAINRQRVWGQPDGSGVVHHVEMGASS